MSKSDVLKYYVYRLTASHGYTLPILILFLMSQGLSFSQIATLTAFQAVIVGFGEVPTGYIADRIGRRNSLIVGNLLGALAVLLLAFSSSFVMFLISFSVWGLHQTFLSGSSAAWLYDTLKEELGTERFAEISGKANSIANVATVFAMIFGTYLYTANPVYPFLFAAIPDIMGALVILSFPKSGPSDGSTDQGLTLSEASETIRRSLLSDDLRLFIVYTALFFAVIDVAYDYIQPIVIGQVGRGSVTISAVDIVVPSVMVLGLLYGMFTAVSAVASYYSGHLKSTVGLPRSLSVVPVVTGVVLFLPLLSPVFLVPMLLSLDSSYALTKPISLQYINDEIGPIGRATVLSSVSMVYAAVRAPVSFVTGVMADLTTPLVAVSALGVGIVLVTACLFAVESPVKSARTA